MLGLKRKKVKLSSGFDTTNLDVILSEYKGGKLTTQEAIVKIISLHEHTVAFESLRMSGNHLESLAHHINFYQTCAEQQHNDLMEIVKTLKETHQ